jgi:sec-independent protein translocase protein TatA
MRFGSLGPVELILIVLAIVLIFGASKLGDIGGALGKSIREFKKSSRDPEEEAREREEAARQAVTTTTPAAISTPAATAAPAPAATAEPEKTAAGVGDYRPPDATPTS